MCSSAGVYFRAGYETTIYNTTPNMICTKITEPNDPDYYSIWAGNTSTGSQSLYICMDKYVPGTPIDAQPPSGPNPLRCSIPSGTIIDNSGTCAAEVYEFSPELYMSRPKDSVNQDGPIIFNSITSLPPVL